MDQFLHLCVSIFCALLQLKFSRCYLHPYESQTREMRSLNGLWDFKISPVNDINKGFNEMWYMTEFKDLGDSIKIPVPASFNDITTNKTIRDYVGWVWYQRKFYAPDRWLQNDNPVKVFVHFGGVHHFSIVFLNGHKVGEHVGGHLPFQLELGNGVLDIFNVLTVAVNNTLTPVSIPQGYIMYPKDESYPPGYRLYKHQCDYFDYAGINRPVLLFTTPKVHVTGVNVTTDIGNDLKGIVKFTVSTSAKAGCKVKMYDKEFMGKVVAASDGCSGTLTVNSPQLWWPAFTHNKTSGYLYTLEIYLNTPTSGADVYRLPIGIRTVSWNSTSILINNEPVYLTGFGMHEDSEIRGRGFDYAVMARDLNLISWVGANAIRTSHYPYAEETLDEADAAGILVIVEAPACSLVDFGDELYERHKTYMLEMMSIHRNRPSVIMWSLANEPVSNTKKADQYFGNLTYVVKENDSSRPVTFVTSQPINNDTAVRHMDMVCVNRYRAWYSDPGHTELIVHQVMEEMRGWHSKYDRPVVVTEYGAGAISGLHTLPESMWSEDYQVETHLEHFKAFDMLRQEGTIAGELMWNFVDFITPQEYIRPGACVKGLFTRQRQPKHAAHIVRERYLALKNCSMKL